MVLLAEITHHEQLKWGLLTGIGAKEANYAVSKGLTAAVMKGKEKIKSLQGKRILIKQVTLNHL